MLCSSSTLILSIFREKNYIYLHESNHLLLKLYGNLLRARWDLLCLRINYYYFDMKVNLSNVKPSGLLI